MKAESYIKYLAFSKNAVRFLGRPQSEKIYVDQNQRKIPHPPLPPTKTYKIVSLDTVGNTMDYGKWTHLKSSEAERFLEYFYYLIK